MNEGRLKSLFVALQYIYASVALRGENDVLTEADFEATAMPLDCAKTLEDLLHAVEMEIKEIYELIRYNLNKTHWDEIVNQYKEELENICKEVNFSRYLARTYSTTHKYSM